LHRLRKISNIINSPFLVLLQRLRKLIRNTGVVLAIVIRPIDSLEYTHNEVGLFVVFTKLLMESTIRLTVSKLRKTHSQLDCTWKEMNCFNMCTFYNTESCSVIISYTL